MRNVFKDQKLQQEFDEKGFVVLDFLTPGELEQARQLQQKNKTEKFQEVTGEDVTYKLSFFDTSIDHKRKMFNEINSFFKDKVDRFLDRYKPLLTNIFVKETGTGEVTVHQNWTFVDESKFTSVSIWCPLVDVSRENGALEVIPGTHKVLCDVRGPSIQVVFLDLIDVVKEKYMEPFIIKAGQVAVVDDSILHYSPINTTATPRPAFQLIMIPEEAQAIHYYKSKESKEDKVEIFEVNPDFFFNFSMTERPQNVKHIGFKEYKHHNLTEGELKEKISHLKPGSSITKSKSQSSFWKKLVGLETK